MKRTALGVFGCTLMALWAALAWSQDEVMQLKGGGNRRLERPAVTFPHEKHAELMECSRCHHDYDAYGVNKGSEGRACIECHGNGGANPVPLQRAYHEQCLSCHERVKCTAEPGSSRHVRPVPRALGRGPAASPTGRMAGLRYAPEPGGPSRSRPKTPSKGTRPRGSFSMSFSMQAFPPIVLDISWQEKH